MAAGDTNGRIERLFAALPGVRVAWVQPQPSQGQVRFGLAVSDPRTLSRLVHLACSINVPVQVEIDWACQKGHDDPGCVRYDFRVPVGPDDERLGLLEQELAELAAGLPGLACEPRSEDV